MPEPAPDVVHGDEIDAPPGLRWQRISVGQSSGHPEGVHGTVQTSDLGLIEPLLLAPEGMRSATPDLDHDEHRRRARVEGDDVDLVSTHAHLPSQDGPSLVSQPIRDRDFGRIARPSAGCAPVDRR